ncbi:hypothetical protein Leryth_015078, partial [Lithospermum erythrorhizon]
NGVRGLMLDMYDFNNDIWLCHSFGANCYNVTAFVSVTLLLHNSVLSPWRKPSEIVTIFVEDYVTSSRGLSKVFSAAGLSK